MNEQPLIIDGLTPRESALDSYYRMTWALDLDNWDLFVSGWSKSHTPVFLLAESDRHYTGLDEIKAGLYDVVAGGLDTQHMATNARVSIDTATKTGRMWIQALNQHYRKGTEKDHTAPRLWGGNRYMFDVVEDEDGQWRITKWTTEFGWREGELAIVGDATQRAAEMVEQVRSQK